MPQPNQQTKTTQNYFCWGGIIYYYDTRSHYILSHLQATWEAGFVTLFLVCNIILNHLKEIWEKTSIFLKIKEDLNFFQMEEDLNIVLNGIFSNGRQPKTKIMQPKTMKL